MMTLLGEYRGMMLSDLLIEQWLPAAVADIQVGGLCLDHRRLNKGELFMAVPGNVHDGRKFIAEAIKMGASAVVKEKEKEQDSSEEVIAWQGQVPIIPVAGLSQHLSAIAARFYKDPSARLSLIGITGTNGKSTCSHLMAQLYQRLGTQAAVMGTLGYGCVNPNSCVVEKLTDTGLTTSDAISNQKILAELNSDGADLVAMEVSSHALEQNRVATIHFDAAIFTNLTRDHLDYHGSMESYALAKQKLFAMAGLNHRIVNIDDPWGAKLAALPSDDAHTWTYSVSNDRADLYVRSVDFHERGIDADLDGRWGKGQLRSSLIGQFNLQNLLAVITTCCARGHELQTVLNAARNLQPVSGRMEKINSHSDISVVVDYAHTPDSLQQVLVALRPHTQKRLWCVFGCGGDRDKGKRPLMAQVAEKLADKVVVTSDNPRTENADAIVADIKAGFKNPEKVTVISDRADAIAQTIARAHPGDCIVIAGKGHEDYQLIGADRLPFSDIKQARVALRLRETQKS
jgi:UDP-N-acetylmuramoyl-L-alanyl-D-glutamate--2,6-diaminopimelate ligase